MMMMEAVRRTSHAGRRGGGNTLLLSLQVLRLHVSPSLLLLCVVVLLLIILPPPVKGVELEPPMCAPGTVWCDRLYRCTRPEDGETDIEALNCNGVNHHHHDE